MTFDQEELRENLAAFQANVVETRTYRLHHAFGLLCYSISPRGAEKLIASCFPLAPIEVAYPGDRKIRTIGLDATMNAFYREMLAYVCFPPLAVSPNDHATSSTVEERADSARPTAFDLTPSSRLRLSTEARYAIAGDDRGVLLLKRDALVGELPNVALPLIAGIFERGSFAAEEATALSGEAWEDVRELLLGLLELDVVCLDEEEAVGSAQSSRPPAP